MTTGHRKGVGSAIVGVVVVATLALGTAFPPAEAQDESGERLMVLETQVAAQATRVADLADRVAMLEASAAADESPATSGETHTITGEVRLHLFSGNEEGKECFGYGPAFKSYRAGADVIVEDNNGNVLALGELGEGTSVPSTKGEVTDCLMPFQVENVPESDYYVIHIAVRRALTGGRLFSRDELEDLNWHISVTVS
jgi:hypothetical protein